MKIKITCLIISIALVFGAISCGTNTKITQPISTDTLGLAMGTPETFDIITWNIENFPKDGARTIEALVPIIPALKVECIAVEEVTNPYDVQNLVSQLPGWSSIVSPLYYGLGLALLYDSTRVHITNHYSIYTDMSGPFPRAPLVCEAVWQDQNITIIINHLKALGNNVIDEGDPNDEEVRRREACQLLDEYVRTNLNDRKVIILGDFNDQIQEPLTTNVFMSFIDKPDEYLFTDMTIAQHLTQQNCSYPTYSSHIDHILITNELFEAFDRGNDYVKTIQIEKYINGGWDVYDRYISDHRPVGARFRFSR